MKLERETVKQILAEVVAETFEGMAFLEVLPGEAAGEEAEQREWLWARVGVHTPHRGIITIACPHVLATEITHTMYGELDPKAMKQAVVDALGEFANTIAGALIGRLSCDRKLMSLGLPEHGKGMPADSALSSFWFVTAEMQPLLIDVSLETLREG